MQMYNLIFQIIQVKTCSYKKIRLYFFKNLLRDNFFSLKVMLANRHVYLDSYFLLFSYSVFFDHEVDAL